MLVNAYEEEWRKHILKSQMLSEENVQESHKVGHLLFSKQMLSFANPRDTYGAV